MDPTMVSLLVALIGASAGLVGGYFTGRRQARLEYEKWLRARKDDLAKEARLAAAEFVRKLAAATHSIVWLAWKVRFRRSKITEQDISMYDEEIHALIPEIVGALAVTSALSTQLYESMNDFAEEFYKLDGQMAEVASALLDGTKTDIEEIATLHGRAYNLNRYLTQNVNEAFVKLYQSESS